MSTKLHNVILQSPGTMGLNTQDADNVQTHDYATVASNCIISKNGTVESRKGTLKVNASAATGTPTLDVVFSYVEDDGTEHIISTGGNKIYSGTTTLTDRTGALTITADNWQFQNYKGEVFGYQTGHAPIFWDGTAGSFALLSSKGTAAGLVNSKLHLSAYGRSWVVDTTSNSTVKYSDLLVPEAFTGGTSGSIDLDSVWPYSNDTITALAVHNNNLIIFCLKSVVIYSSANDVTSLALSDVISANGCIARDSVQVIGNDIFYLANDGVRALSRTILQDNMPLSDISAKIRDDIISSITNGDMATVRSTYNEQEGFYLIHFPGDMTYACDVRRAQEGIFRWTTWDATIYGIASSVDDTLYMGLEDGYLSKYSGYLDTDTSTGNVDQTYVLKFRSPWMDLGLESVKGVWKKAIWYVSTLVNLQMITTWGFDFQDEESSYTNSVTGGGPTLYGTGVYGTDPYGSAAARQTIKVPLSKTGSLIRLGFQSVVDNGQFSFNKIDLLLKSGHRR